MSNYVYLDWASTAPVRYFAKDYYIPGNSNSPHALGLQANQALNEARQRIMDCLGVKSGKVLVGGTASQLVDNLIARIDKNIISVSEYEHDCLYKYGKHKFNYLNSLQVYLKKPEPKQKIICWMMTNNVTGAIFPVEEIGKMCRDAGAYYIMDAVAAVGHYPISDNLESFCDCLITSAHKYSGPQGTGCMWVSDRFAKFLGLSDDSHEEYGLIHGTPNVSAAVAMSYAMEHAIKWEQQDRETKALHYYSLFTYLAAKLAENRIEFEVIESKDNPKSTCAINAVTLYGINTDALTQYLSTKSIYISPGHSACASNEDYRVLEALGLTKDQASQTIRVSFGEDTSTADIDALVDGIVEFKNLFI